MAVLSTVNGEKITFLAVCGKAAVKAGIRAGDIIKNVAKICAGSGGGTGFVRAELLRHRTAAPQRRVGHPRRILRLEILRQNRRLLRKKIDQLTES